MVRLIKKKPYLSVKDPVTVSALCTEMEVTFELYNHVGMSQGQRSIKSTGTIAKTNLSDSQSLVKPV